MGGCLQGIRVLELARHQAGPYCGRMLNDLGAEVIKIERIEGDDQRGRGPFTHGQSAWFTCFNRGKKSITLNLRHEKGREIFRGLVKQSDVVLENFRPGVIEEMGFGYKALCQLIPSIILVSVSGFGQYGPYRDRPSFDPIGQAMSGLMHATGRLHGHPVLTAAPIIDRTASLHATIGTLGALFSRQMTGKGQWVDASLLDSALSLVDVNLAAYFGMGNDSFERGGSGIRCKDGWVVMSAVGVRLWDRLLRAIGRDDLANDPEYMGDIRDEAKIKHRDKIFEDWVRERTVEEVIKVMDEAEVPCGPVMTLEQVAKDRHLHERQVMVEVEASEGSQEKIMVPGYLIRFSETPTGIGRVPSPGEHNGEIYGQLLGLGQEELTALKEKGVV